MYSVSFYLQLKAMTRGFDMIFAFVSRRMILIPEIQKSDHLVKIYSGEVSPVKIFVFQVFTLRRLFLFPKEFLILKQTCTRRI